MPLCAGAGSRGSGRHVAWRGIGPDAGSDARTHHAGSGSSAVPRLTTTMRPLSSSFASLPPQLQPHAGAALDRLPRREVRVGATSVQNLPDAVAAALPEMAELGLAVCPWSVGAGVGVGEPSSPAGVRYAYACPSECGSDADARGGKPWRRRRGLLGRLVATVGGAITAGVVTVGAVLVAAALNEQMDEFHVEHGGAGDGGGGSGTKAARKAKGGGGRRRGAGPDIMLGRG